MKRFLSVICLSIFLAGCAGSNQSEPAKHVRVDPSWPDPVKAWDGKWQVKVIDGEAWVGMPFDQSQQLRIWLNDVLRYTKDANGMICYYRAELKEQRCKL